MQHIFLSSAALRLPQWTQIPCSEYLQYNSRFNARYLSLCSSVLEYAVTLFALHSGHVFSSLNTLFFPHSEHKPRDLKKALPVLHLRYPLPCIPGNSLFHPHWVYCTVHNDGYFFFPNTPFFFVTHSPLSGSFGYLYMPLLPFYLSPIPILIFFPMRLRPLFE